MRNGMRITRSHGDTERGGRMGGMQHPLPAWSQILRVSVTPCELYFQSFEFA